MSNVLPLSKMPSSSSPPLPPWLDLPDHLINLILERLPLSDYIRFAAVCTKFQTVQKSHQQPPLPLPLLFPSTLDIADDSTATCYCPFEHKFYRLNLSTATSKTPLTHFCMAFSHGWLLIFSSSSSSFSFYLLNPISKSHIDMPLLRITDTDLDYYCSLVGISSSPPNPNCYVLVIGKNNRIFLFHFSRPVWNPLPQPPETVSLKPVSSPFFCKGKFYCVLSDWGLLVVDPLTDIVEYLEMELRQWNSKKGRVFCLESKGDVLMVVKGELADDIKLFRADIERKVWVKVENIGDRVLLLSSDSSYSVVGDDVGLKGNCIVFFRNASEIKVFDLGMGMMTDVACSGVVDRRYKSFWNNDCRWFFPTLT